MGQEDYRHLNNVEDRTYQGQRNPLKLHSKLLYNVREDIKATKRENMMLTKCLQGRLFLSEWKIHGRNHPPSADGAFPKEPWDSNFSHEVSRLEEEKVMNSPKHLLQQAFKIWKRRPIVNGGQTMPAHHAVHFFLNNLVLLRMKDHGKKKSVNRGYCLSGGYQRIEHMDFLSILTVSSAAGEGGGELWLVIKLRH